MYVETAEDLNRKYGQTFVLLNNETIYVNEFFQESPGKIIMNHSKADNPGKEIMNHITPNEIEAFNFDAMYVNNVDFDHPRSKKDKLLIPATLFRRSPRRQWKRGLGHDNTVIACPVLPLYQSINKGLSNFDTHLSFKLIERLRNPIYPMYEEALKLCNQFIAIALSPEFVVMLSSISTDKYLIASTHGFIGEGTAKNIWIRHQPSEQEMSDYLKRTNQNVALEVGPCP